MLINFRFHKLIIKYLGFFYRNSIKESFYFVVRESNKNISSGTRHIVKHEEYICYIEKANENVGAFIFCD